MILSLTGCLLCDSGLCPRCSMLSQQLRQQSHDLLLNIGRQIRPMRVALRTSQPWKLARSPRDHRYCHQHLLLVASIEAVFAAQWGLGPVVVRPEGPFSVRGGTGRSRTLAWIPGSYSSPPRPASRAALPEPAMSGPLPSCNAPPPGRALSEWHAPTLVGRAMGARNSRLHGHP